MSVEQDPVPNLRMVAPSPQFSRAVVGVLAVSHFALGYFTAQLTYLPGAGWWGLWFVVAGACCAAYSLSLHPTAAIYAGALTVTAYAMRGGALLVGHLAGDRTLSDAQTYSGLVIFATLILSWGPVFWKFTVPNAAVRQRARLERD